MDKDLQIFTDTVKKFMKKELAPFSEKLDFSPETAQYLELFKKLYEIFPINELDSNLLTPASMAPLLYEMSKECAGIGAFTGYLICGELLRKFFFPKVSSRTVAISIFEDEDTGIDDGVLKFNTEFKDNCINGKKRSVFLAPLAEHFLVFAKNKNKNFIAMVKNEGTEISSPSGNIGIRALPCADVKFNRIKVIDCAGLEMAHILYLFGILSLFTSSCACGTALQALIQAWEYAKNRYQAGKIIKEHNAIQLMYEENMSRIIHARDAILSASARFDINLPESLKNAVRTKIACGRIFVNATLDAIQMLGGYGYMRDYGIEKRFRDCVALSLLPADNTRMSLFLNTN